MTTVPALRADEGLCGPAPAKPFQPLSQAWSTEPQGTCERVAYLIYHRILGGIKP